MTVKTLDMDRAMVCVAEGQGDNWFRIEWADHEHAELDIPEPGPIEGFAYWHSGRVSGSDIEGTGAEMRVLASAIETGGRVVLKRCAVETNMDGTVTLWCPNSSVGEPHRASRAAACDLAASIRAVVDGPTATAGAEPCCNPQSASCQAAATTCVE